MNHPLMMAAAAAQVLKAAIADEQERTEKTRKVLWELVDDYLDTCDLEKIDGRLGTSSVA
jgi:hypothetical protein